ncbi:nickel ABC transporter permease subunit NikC [Helicobacter sp. MIT 11-5569]|uniref:nickel ABC transporter permease subunit NikC n=1 Tax=Helicobacter sp. MIT 11-5569 TaxID=1548151 RepID=UPI00051FB1B3|nr:nickel ABC transporter permease subunit NikC [Helicobacter sp. MIT 11-5569]TLD81427.1 nickel ABC transporter permease subunit NikC [Helicobacter sp. MIT 11-5569]
MSKKSLKLYLPLTGVLCIFLLAIFAHLLPYDPIEIDIGAKFAPPSIEHWLGTDHLGRDVLTRLIYGARTSLFSVFVICFLILFFSFIVGFIAGYKGGYYDSILMRICDAFFAFPTFILALFLIGILGVGLSNVMIAIVLTHWAWYARMVRSLVLEARSHSFVLASIAMGSSEFQVIVRHILPSVFSQIIILITLDIGHMLLHVSGLSFLGFGVAAPTPEWGVMINDASPYIMEHYELMLYPGMAIFITVALFNLLGEALRDRLDPECEIL